MLLLKKYECFRLICQINKFGTNMTRCQSDVEELGIISVTLPGLCLHLSTEPLFIPCHKQSSFFALTTSTQSNTRKSLITPCKHQLSSVVCCLDLLHNIFCAKRLDLNCWEWQSIWQSHSDLHSVCHNSLTLNSHRQ